MSCELEGTETGLVGYYKFNQGNGAANNSTITTLSDSSGNGNTGVLNGFALNGSSSNWLDGSSITTGSNCSTLSLDAFTTELDFSIYPNPTKNTVSIDLKDNNKAEITIYDLNGRVIKSQIIKSKEKINMSELANGIYLIKIITNGEIITKRVVKQ